MGFVFDKVNKIITVEAPQTEVTIQDLYDAIRDYEDEVYNMEVGKICDASGKEELGGGVRVGITLKLIDWKLKFEDRSGPNYITCNVRGGNLVCYDTSINDYVNPIEPSAYVKAYAKLDRKHGLKIPYRDPNGILREYEVDFIVKTDDTMFLVETKSDRDINKPNVAIKAKAAVSWCNSATDVQLPEGISQPLKWEYLIISESLFKSNKGLSFEGFIPLCRALRDRIISEKF